MTKKNYKAIIFDLDGTLINSLPYHFLAFKDMLLEHGVRISDQHLRVLMGLPTEDILKELKKKYGFLHDIMDLREERRYHYFKFLGLRDIIFPGVRKLLSELRLNYKLAIATGSSQIVFYHSTKKDFQALFDTIITIGDVVKGKPDPEQLLLAAKKLKVRPKDCMMIGDSFYDGLAAKRAKIDFIGITSGYSSRKDLKKQKPTALINKITELKNIL
jgi:HAD superfamily hydrolase (TIGR01549 family)